MIPKIGRGGNMRGIVAYLAGPGRGDEHVAARVVAGSSPSLDGDLAGRVAEVANYLDDLRRAHGADVLVKGKPAHVWHASLSLPPGERLGDEQWRQIASGFVEQMGFADDCRWIAVRHGLSKGREGRPGNDHCHVVVQLSREDGTPANVWNDRHRAHEACAALEREHSLATVEGREMGAGQRGYVRGEREIAERAGRTETQRQFLERAVRGCMVESRSPAEFAEQLARGGVTVKWRAKDGQRVGYSVIGKDGIPYAGGKIARDLSLPRLQEHWRTASPAMADQAARLAAGRSAWASLQSERAGHPGPRARESRQLGRYAQTRAGIALALTSAAAADLKARVRAANREAELERELEEQQQESRRSRERQQDGGIGL